MTHARALLLSLVIACSGESGCGGVENRPATEPMPGSSPRSKPEATDTETLPVAAQVPSRRLEPTLIRIELADLPAPFATESARQSPNVIAPPDDAALAVPRGFVVQRFASDLTHARWLAEAPDGRVLVARSRDEVVTWLSDADGDGVAEARGVFADHGNSTDIPFGMAFVDGFFYLGNQDEVRRFRWNEGQERLTDRGERVVELPGGGYNQHWTRNVISAGDGRHLYVSVGSATNASPEREPRATVQRLDLSTGAMTTFASGLRNPVGLAVHPRTGVLYATVNERDELGDGLVPDYFTAVREGAFYGWPYAYLSPDNLDPRLLRDGRSERPELAARTVTPDVLFESHSAALGVAFHDRAPFPARYRNGAFVAHRGSWNRSEGTGYRIVFVPFTDEGRPAEGYEPFVDGFLVDPSGPTTWGRPVGVLSHSDGALYFTEEGNGVVYRVSYRG